MKNRYVIGDIHGEYERLMKCLKAVNFDYENDELISLGDVVDRGLNSYAVVEELLKIKNLIAIRGNHDDEFFQSYLHNTHYALYSQGAKETIQSYQRYSGDSPHPPFFKMPPSHINFFANIQQWYYKKDGVLFVHGGFDRHEYIEKQEKKTLAWDRDLFLAALSFEKMNSNYKFKMKDKFKHVYIGHTPTTYWDITTPITAANITNLDTGSGKGGMLTLMNLDTKQFVQA